LSFNRKQGAAEPPQRADRNSAVTNCALSLAHRGNGELGCAEWRCSFLMPPPPLGRFWQTPSWGVKVRRSGRRQGLRSGRRRLAFPPWRSVSLMRLSRTHQEARPTKVRP
jgi:hypothetical protein